MDFHALLAMNFNASSKGPFGLRGGFLPPLAAAAPRCLSCGPGAPAGKSFTSAEGRRLLLPSAATKAPLVSLRGERGFIGAGVELRLFVGDTGVFRRSCCMKSAKSGGKESPESRSFFHPTGAINSTEAPFWKLLGEELMGVSNRRQQSLEPELNSDAGRHDHIDIYPET